MEFKDMQEIWNNQSNENIYAINEEALQAYVMRKGKSVTRSLNMYEMGMVAVNFIVGIFLIVDALNGSEQVFRFVVPSLYLAFSLIAVVRSLARRREIVRFEETVVGELDKAIWQINYLIAQTKSMWWWYVLPLLLVTSIFLIINEKILWALSLILIVLPLSLLGSRWESNRFYLPKKQALESLRDRLVGSQT